jgi:Rps23 Pro-64 3,4-dihydroxylase Tpa1-like proline 4-hydroxylase
MQMDQNFIGQTIAEKLRAQKAELSTMWLSATPFKHFFIDDLFPEAYVHELAKAFPDSGKLMTRSSMRERKRVGVDVRNYDPRIAEYLFAFQHPRVIQLIEEITQLSGLEADPTLYASGISLMGKGDFLNPHIDNSHDGDRRRHRVLNLLWYVSPHWKLENGGNLELWDRRVKQARTIVSNFNRLLVMETHETSWHSVSKVVVNEPRTCISNYYFSRSSPVSGNAYARVTTFAGRPEEKIKRVLLKLDGIARNRFSKMFPRIKRKVWHRISAP